MKEIPLTNSNLVALVDDEIYPLIIKYTWYLNKGRSEIGYAYCGSLSMSNLIMGLPQEGHVWDHKDRNGLNNQRSNLRLATKEQNNYNRKLNSNNSSGHRGVSLVHDFRRYNRKPRWRAMIEHKGKQTVIGYFKTKEEAIEARDKKARELFGEFAAFD